MIPPFLQQPNETASNGRKPPSRFISRTLLNLTRVITLAQNRFYLSNRKGLLQQTSHSVKVGMLLLFPLAITVVHHISLQLVLLTVIVGLSIFSHINFFTISRQTLWFVLLFGLLVSFPASLNVFNDGKIVFRIIAFDQPRRWWIYHIPHEIGITKEGLEFVLRICLKIFNSVSFVLLILSTTGFENIVRGMRIMKVPHFFLLVLTLAYKYIVILSQSMYQSFQAMSLRSWNRTNSPLEKEIASGRIGFLFRKGWENYELTYKAMLARGFNGEFRLLSTHDSTIRDYLIGMLVLVIAILIIYLDNHG